MLYKRVLNGNKVSKFAEVWNDKNDKLIHTKHGRHCALNQGWEAKFLVDASEEVNNNENYSEGMIKCLSNIGALVYLQEEQSDYKYLSHLNKFDQENGFGVLRGLSWLKFDPVKTTEKELLTQKKKTGPKLKNLGG